MYEMCVIEVVGLEVLKKNYITKIVKAPWILTIEFSAYYHFLLEKRMKLAPLRGFKWRNVRY